MPTDKFEFRKLFVPLEYRKEAPGFKDFTIWESVNTTNSDIVWEKASELGLEGWELVGSVPIIFSGWHVGTVYPYTGGYTLLFKRRIQE